MYRFIHSSDLHIGKRFGNLPEDLRGRLREVRHAVLGRLADQAQAVGAEAVLLAGDTFDTETPTPAILRQAIAAMAERRPLRWVLLPGNHDSLLAEALWSAARSNLPDNVILATEAAPLVLAPDVTLLPAPCTTRRPGRDLTDWMDRAQTPEGHLRIGLAHGAVQSFSEDGVGADIIAPDRVPRAGLDYLALGDWHGQLRIEGRTWYSGSPEPDRFKHAEPGRALAVTLASPGAAPEVQPVETGSFAWRTLELRLLGSEDAAATMAQLLPTSGRRQTLLQVRIAGRIRPAARLELAETLGSAKPEFAELLLDAEELVTECAADDLDAIDRAGALRQAAEALLAESLDDSRTAAERAVARGALDRLFSYCQALPL